MAIPYFFRFFFVVVILFCISPQFINSSTTCSLDFSQFPYEAHSECFENLPNSPPFPALQSCCDSALSSIFQAMAVRANQSKSIFLEPAEARDCATQFHSLHNKTNFSQCELQNYISTPATDLCSSDVDSVITSLGTEKFKALQSNCSTLISGPSYSDDVCFDCVVLYRQSLEDLRKIDGSKGRGGCAEALLVSLSSSYSSSKERVQGTFSCLWEEIEFQLALGKQQKDGFFFGSKKLLATIIMALALVILAPILYKITRKRLKNDSEKEMESLSVIALKKTLEDESRILFICSDLYVFSQDEVANATKHFDNSNCIGEGSLGKTYVGIMPSGMRAAIKRINKGIKLHDFIDQILGRAKIRHPNLVSMLGYCDKGEQCLVYEYCANGDLARWLLGNMQRVPILTWELRLNISVGIARGLCFLHNNPFERMVHGGIQLTDILLNEKLEAKISDSILSRCKLISKTKESQTAADDVFCLGVILLQILTGRQHKGLADEAKDVILKGGSLGAMVDPRLKGAFVATEFHQILSTAVLCTAANVFERPSMEQVLKRLEQTLSLV